MVMGPRAGKRPALPDHLESVQPDSSRVLDAAAKKQEARQAQQQPAVSYRAVYKGERDNV